MVSLQEFLHSDKMTEAGPVDMIDADDSEEEDIALPGVMKGDMSSRKTKPEIRVKCVKFSPTGKTSLPHCFLFMMTSSPYCLPNLQY